MAGFKTHIGTSTVIGIGYGAAGFAMGLPLEASVLAAGLCSVGGILPDIDSETGKPMREITAFAAAVIPMLMIERFQQLGLTHETMAVAGGLVYLLVRFGLPRLMGRYTVHRGMWHSVPAALTAALIAFLICACDSVPIRLYRAGGMFLGYMVHLTLDELWSIEWKGGRVQFKRSFGTAIKFFSKSRWANFSTYAKLALLAVACVGDPFLMKYMGYEHSHAHQTAKEILERSEKLPGETRQAAREAVENLADRLEDVVPR